MAATPTPKPRGTSKATQAAAGVAGALAFLGIGWAMGARSTAKPPQAIYQSAPLPPTTPTYPTTPGGWGDDGPEDGQWGTIPQQGGVTPAQPGTGIGIAPPQTGTAGSGVAAAPPGTISGTSIGTSSATVSSTGTSAGAATPRTGPVGG